MRMDTRWHNSGTALTIGTNRTPGPDPGEADMTYHVLIIQGHPDPAGGHFGHALADAYAEGATEAGHEVRRIEVTRLDFPLVRTQAEWAEGEPPEPIRAAQDDIAWCSHIVLHYPLWLGTMPALLKGFLEQVLRRDFAFGGTPGQWNRALRGRSARIVVTMGMPAAVYRWYFGAHSLGPANASRGRCVAPSIVSRKARGATCSATT